MCLDDMNGFERMNENVVNGRRAVSSCTQNNSYCTRWQNSLNTLNNIMYNEMHNTSGALEMILCLLNVWTAGSVMLHLHIPWAWAPHGQPLCCIPIYGIVLFLFHLWHHRGNYATEAVILAYQFICTFSSNETTEPITIVIAMLYLLNNI